MRRLLNPLRNRSWTNRDWCVQAVRLSTLISCGACLLTAAADFARLRPSARWLATERLRGTLFHHTIIEPMRPLYVRPAGKSVSKGLPRTVPLRLKGEHHILVAPTGGRTVEIRVRTVAVRMPYDKSLITVFDDQGREIRSGAAALGQSLVLNVPVSSRAPFVVLLNRGPASSTVSEISIANAAWGIDVNPRPQYMRGPLRYQFLRELREAGFNLAMVDLESYPGEFLSDAGLADWRRAAAKWADAARRYHERIMIAVDLGGSRAEVASWGDVRKGLYLDMPDNLPVAPCPLSRKYWENIYLRRGRVVARIARDNPYVVGFGLDPEMYQCHRYGHYLLTGTCFCDHCFGGFLDARGMDRSVLETMKTARERYEWLKSKKLFDGYEKNLEDRMARLAAGCRDELHRIHPDLLLNVYVIEIGNWFCRGLARGFGMPDLPVINFCEHTYYSVGYDPAWLDKTLAAFRDWGANVLQGSALWDLHFPPVKDAFLAAHAYNLAVRCEGWWFWPGDHLYEGATPRLAYLGIPASCADYWHACVLANTEIANSAKSGGGGSALDRYEVVPWRGKLKARKKNFGVPETMIRRVSGPRWTVRVAAPGALSWVVPGNAPGFGVYCRAPGAGNAAALRLKGPDGNVAATASGELDAPVFLSAQEHSAPGLWTVQIDRSGRGVLKEVDLAFEGPPVPFCPDPKHLLAAATKRPGLVGYWPLDEGRGAVAHDRSQSVAFDGVVRNAQWVRGVRGTALAFDGRSAFVTVPLGYGLHALRRFSLSAWVRLHALPVRGNGATIINKGPEAPVQHFWWWIGYPPNYALTLEMGNEKHRWGASFSSGRLTWELNRWYHVAAVFRCEGGVSTAVLYRDGEEVGRKVRDEEFHSGSYDLRFGSYGGLHWLNGALDEIKVWDRALTVEEVREEYLRSGRRPR